MSSKISSCDCASINSDKTWEQELSYQPQCVWLTKGMVVPLNAWEGIFNEVEGEQGHRRCADLVEIEISFLNFKERRRILMNPIPRTMVLEVTNRLCQHLTLASVVYQHIVSALNQILIKCDFCSAYWKSLPLWIWASQKLEECKRIRKQIGGSITSDSCNPCPSLFCNILIRFLLSGRISVTSSRNSFHCPVRRGSEVCLLFWTITLWIFPLSLLSTHIPSSLLSPLPQRFVQRTAEDMAFVSEAPAAARRAGWAQPVISERVTHAAMSTGPAGMASVNAARAGTESTAPLVGRKKTRLLLRE